MLVTQLRPLEPKETPQNQYYNDNFANDPNGPSSLPEHAGWFLMAQLIAPQLKELYICSTDRFSRHVRRLIQIQRSIHSVTLEMGISDTKPVWLISSHAHSDRHVLPEL